MTNVIISSAVSIDFFNHLRSAARERHMSLSALIRLSLETLLGSDRPKPREESGDAR